MPSAFANPARSTSATAALCVVVAVVFVAAGCKKAQEAKDPGAPVAATPPPPTERPDHEAPAVVVADPAAQSQSVGTPLQRDKLPGLIAFVREEAGRKRPYLVRPDGTGLRALPSPEGVDAVVMAASKDGRHLAGVAAVGEGEGHTEQLLLWTLPSGEVREVGPKSRRARSPSFSPDGKKLVFESGHERFSNLYVVNVDGEAAPMRLTDSEAGDFEPSWSPDGQWVVFASSREGDPEIFRVRADGKSTEPERLTAFHQEDVAPRWSPGAVPGQIAFLSNRTGEDALFLMAPDGARQRRLGPEGGAREHRWSPDGTALVMAVKAEGGKARVVTVAPDSGKSVFLTPGQAVEDMPSFSPDGAHVVYVSDEGGAPSLWLVRADGTGRTRLFRESPKPAASAPAAHAEKADHAGHGHGHAHGSAASGVSDWLPLWFSGSSG